MRYWELTFIYILKYLELNDSDFVVFLMLCYSIIARGFAGEIVVCIPGIGDIFCVVWFLLN